MKIKIGLTSKKASSAPILSSSIALYHFNGLALEFPLAMVSR